MLVSHQAMGCEALLLSKSGQNFWSEGTLGVGKCVGVVVGTGGVLRFDPEKERQGQSEISTDKLHYLLNPVRDRKNTC